MGAHIGNCSGFVPKEDESENCTLVEKPTTVFDEFSPLSGKDYYGGTACFDAIRKYLGEEGTKYWLKGNILKYLYRYNGKDGIKDLVKALEYLNMLVDMET